MNRHSSWLGVVLGIVLSLVAVVLHAQTTAGIGTHDRVSGNGADDEFRQ